LASSSPPPSGLDGPWVSLDLETTGLSAGNDEIIEIGAVKFRGEEDQDTLQTLVNPHRRLTSFITRYTGIRQREVDKAPPFAAVAGELASFVGDLPVIGHNIGFDLGFLESKGLRLTNPRIDTWDLAYILLPQAPEYSLVALSEALGHPHLQAHRALPDAIAAQRIFLKLREMLDELDPGLRSEMARLASLSQWSLAYLLQRLESGSRRTGKPMSRARGIFGVDTDSLKSRTHISDPPVSSGRETRTLDEGYLASLLGDSGPLASAIPGYEVRSEQVEMMKAVTEAINQRHHLIVEAGTGIGKSWAYLLPSILYALQNNRRVVVSTNTINLQEQLLNKDIPALTEALKASEGEGLEKLRYTQLKGRANYLCLKRWAHLGSSLSLSPDEATLLSKILVWLEGTVDGDRGEINLTGRPGFKWNLVSAQGAPDCPVVTGPCFLRAARERATASHLVIINHALLLSDLAMGGGLIPEYDTLIIDEAQHLEEEATRHLGFQVTQGEVDEHLQSLSGQAGVLQQAVAAFRGSVASQARRKGVEDVVGPLQGRVELTRERLTSMYKALAQFAREHREPGDDREGAVRVSPSLHKQPAWQAIEVSWENADLSLSDVAAGLQVLDLALEGLEEARLVGYEGLLQEIGHQRQVNSDLRSKLREFIPHPQAERIYWLTSGRQDGSITMDAAPLRVGEELDRRLFSQKGCVVLTSATLTSEDSFQSIRERLGLSDAEELLIGSPFDYPNRALLCLPADVPEPSSWAYQAAIEQAIVDLAEVAEGHTMALFTSRNALQTTASAIRLSLEPSGVEVLAQGIDGTPNQLVRRFLNSPRSVLLGTSSFWEGVDLAGDVLKVLILARLPFNVPTEPVFAARSELYEDSFNQYALPLAALRFRQGFGRLIRTRTDKGAIVVLDRRITSRSYGPAFLASIPKCAMSTSPLRQLPSEVARWLAN